MHGSILETLQEEAILSVASADLVRKVAQLLGRSLALSDERVEALTTDTPLFGAMPELDSMAVATVLTTIEDHFNILIEDDEISGDLFATVGSLADFIARKAPH